MRLEKLRSQWWQIPSTVVLGSRMQSDSGDIDRDRDPEYVGFKQNPSPGRRSTSFGMATGTVVSQSLRVCHTAIASRLQSLRKLVEDTEEDEKALRRAYRDLAEVFKGDFPELESVPPGPRRITEGAMLYKRSTTRNSVTGNRNSVTGSLNEAQPGPTGEPGPPGPRRTQGSLFFRRTTTLALTSNSPAKNDGL